MWVMANPPYYGPITGQPTWGFVCCVKLYHRAQNDVSSCYTSYPDPRYTLIQKLDFPEVFKLTESHTGLRQNTEMLKSTLFLYKKSCSWKSCMKKVSSDEGSRKKLTISVASLCSLGHRMKYPHVIQHYLACGTVWCINRLFTMFLVSWCDTPVPGKTLFLFSWDPGPRPILS